MVVVFSRRKRQAKKHLNHFGRGLTLGALLVLTLVVLLPFILGRQEARLRLQALKSNQITFSDLLRLDATNLSRVNPATYFSLSIPKLKAQAQVIPNVDATDPKVYVPALKKGIAHAAGTYFPGMGGSVTVFAHSTDIAANVAAYNAVFYRLDELEPGDMINVWFLGDQFAYRVTGSKVVPPSDVSVFVKEQKGEKLYLVTCTPPGTTKNRLIVEAERI